MKHVSDYEKFYSSKQTTIYDKRHNLQVRSRFQLSDSRKKPCSVVVVATTGRELRCRRLNGNVILRNVALVTPKAKTRVVVLGVVATSLGNGTGVVAPNLGNGTGAVAPTSSS